jgi:WS/DGAT/MGAT family acyltransferase
VIEGLDRIPGLPPGSFALFLKFHHASVDGQGAAALLKAVHATTAAPDPTEDQQPTLYAERDPTTVELYTRAVAHGVGRAAGLSTLYAKALAKVAGITVDQVVRKVGLAGGRGAAGDSLPAFLKAPMTRFNRPISANRVVEAVALPLAAMQEARGKVEGVTINDLFLAIVGGALRKYLVSKDELPARSLMALMPMSARQGGNVSPGNQVGGMPVPLHTEIADPVQRLRAVVDDAHVARRGADALGRGFLQSMMDELPNWAAEAFFRHYVYPQLNVTVSNIRGPEATLYVAGARLVHFYPVSIATDYIGLNHTGFSYNGVLWITAVACRNMLPDPAFYADCLRASFDEMIAAIDAAAVKGRRAVKANAEAGARTAKAAPSTAAKPRAKGARPATSKGATATRRGLAASKAR